MGRKTACLITSDVSVCLSLILVLVAVGSLYWLKGVFSHISLKLFFVA